MHSRLLSKYFPKVRRAYSSRSPDQVADLVRDFGGEQCAGGWTSALQTPGIDAVFVTTPPDTHLDIALGALGAGKHVIVEKPAFLDVEHFDQVQEAAARAGRMVLVAENYYYKPLLRRLRAIVASGELGEIRLIQINAVKRQRAEGWCADPARAGGGALFEGGIHWVS